MIQKILLTILFLIFSSTLSFSTPTITPDEKQFRLGLRIALQIEEEFPASKNKEEVLRVNRVGLRILSSMDNLTHLYTFNVLDMEEANAFVIPGGFIFVTSGLLDLGFDDDELAFVLGHEIAHAEHDHIFQRKKVADLLSLAMIVLEIYARSRTPPSTDAREEQAEAIARSLAYSLSGAMIVMGYSREQEREADYWGKIYAAKAGYNMEGALTALKKIDIMREKRPDLISSLLMTHPYILDRIEEAKKTPPKFPENLRLEDNISTVGNYIQMRLKEKASQYKDKNKKRASLLLYRNAYHLYPAGREAYRALYELLKYRENEERKKGRFFINYNSIIQGYQNLLDEYPETKLKGEITEKLRKLREEKEETYAWYRNRIGTGMGLNHYYNFVEFFPTSPLIHKARYYLAKKYALAEEYDKALREFLIVEGGADEEWRKKSREEIISIVDKSTNIVLLGRLLNMDFSSEVKNRVNTRLKKVIMELDNLEEFNNFSQQFPLSPHKELIQKRIEKVAEELYVEARVKQLSGNRRKAMEMYRQVLKYAPETISASQIRREFERLDVMRRQR